MPSTIKPTPSPRPTWTAPPPPPPAAASLIPHPSTAVQTRRRPLTLPTTVSTSSSHNSTEKSYGPCTITAAASGGGRRRARWDNNNNNVAGEEDDDEEEDYNQEIAALELYSQRCRGEALVVRASVDGEIVEVLVFRGFSSCLSYGTAVDPAKSVVPARAVIESVDRIKGPFDPSDVEYLEKEISWDSFKTRLIASSTTP